MIVHPFEVDLDPVDPRYVIVTARWEGDNGTRHIEVDTMDMSGLIKGLAEMGRTRCNRLTCPGRHGKHGYRGTV